jgi:hypothetical protein
MLHLLRAGCPWRGMHERHGKLQPLVDLGLTYDWQDMIGSSTVRGHISAVGGKKGGAGFWSLARRFYEQSPRPLRQSRAAYRVHPDWRRSF